MEIDTHARANNSDMEKSCLPYHWELRFKEKKYSPIPSGQMTFKQRDINVDAVMTFIQ